VPNDSLLTPIVENTYLNNVNIIAGATWERETGQFYQPKFSRACLVHNVRYDKLQPFPPENSAATNYNHFAGPVTKP